MIKWQLSFVMTRMTDYACKLISYCNRQLTKNRADKYRNIEIQV